jgi:hypothetical protein
VNTVLSSGVPVVQPERGVKRKRHGSELGDEVENDDDDDDDDDDEDDEYDHNSDEDYHDNQGSSRVSTARSFSRVSARTETFAKFPWDTSKKQAERKVIHTDGFLEIGGEPLQIEYSGCHHSNTRAWGVAPIFIALLPVKETD